MKDLGALARYFTKTLIRLLFASISGFLELFIRTERSRIEQIDDELLLKPATVLSGLIRQGQLTSERLTELYIRRVKQVNHAIQASAWHNFDQALGRAREIDQLLAETRRDPSGELARDNPWLQSPLVGTPVTIKETVSLKGAPFTAGLPSRASRVASKTNAALNRLISEGGVVILCSTNIPAMSKWFDSNNLVYGRTRNPHDLSKVPGGSTGGEAALLAAAGSCLGIGTDLAGSIRIPSNFCGVFGHKPSPHVVPNDGVYPVWRNEDMLGLGPMSRFACDLVPALQLMIPDEKERAKLRLDEPVDLRKIKLFYCDDLGDPLVAPCSTNIKMALQAAVQHMKSSYQIEASRVQFDEFKYGMALWLAELEGTRVYTDEHPDGMTLFNPFLELAKWLVCMSELPLTVIICLLAEETFGSKENSPKMLYLRKRAQQLRNKFNELLGQDGVLMMPAHPTTAPPHQLTLFKFLNCAYTAIVNTLHAPVTQVPVAKSPQGMPIGVQLIATKHNDRLTMAVACELDKAFHGWQPPV